VAPDRLLNVVVAAMLGIMTSVTIIFLLNYLAPAIDSEQDAEESLGLPVLCMLPQGRLYTEEHYVTWENILR